MTQPEDVPVRPVAETAPPRYDEPPSRLLQVAAAVGIVAGVVFVVAVVFFAGFFLGASSPGYGGGWRFGGHMGPGGRTGTCPMMNGGEVMPGGMMGPGMMGPGAVPSAQPSTPVPPTPRP